VDSRNSLNKVAKRKIPSLPLQGLEPRSSSLVSVLTEGERVNVTWILYFFVCDFEGRYKSRCSAAPRYNSEDLD